MGHHAACGERCALRAGDWVFLAANGGVIMRRSLLPSRRRVSSAQLFRVVECHPVDGRSIIRASMTRRDAEKLAHRCAASRPPQSRVLYTVELISH